MRILEHFKSICAVPHCSFDTQKLGDFLREFCVKNDAKVRVDEWGNIHAIKGEPKICLQSHYDMVCIGEAPNLELYEEQGFLKAKNSSLGADNGIGVAIMMSALENFKNVECLFTNDEEVGLIGANNFNGKIVSKYLLNLDSEDDNEVIIGCAGGLNIFAKISARMKKITPEQGYEVEVFGLSGGHSGVEIHKNIPNAIKILAKILRQNNAKIVSISGGERSNSIPTNAKAIVVASDFKVAKNQNIRVKKLGLFDKVLSNSDKILTLINAFAQGVRSYDKELATPINSINLSTLSQKNGSVEIEFFARAMDDSGICDLRFETSELAAALGFELSYKDRSVAWRPSQSEFAKDVLNELRNFRPNAFITAIHAGLECGVLADKQHGLVACSIGPNIYSPHSKNERVELASIKIISQVVDKILQKYQ